ncbi:hypothetical protein GCM10022393_05030 [Aquimarina addita]|uniref:Outer membrane protein beta-barrel domain-containing protein n=1 Tax=Aquimarina addita TaxID=870485 RepID=A0ABP7X9V9_9FLAO
MAKKKDIGKVFKESFDGFKRAPDTTWETIELELDKEKSTKTSYWLVFSGILLFLSLGVSGILTYHYFITNPKTPSKITTNNFEKEFSDTTTEKSDTIEVTNHNSLTNQTDSLQTQITDIEHLIPTADNPATQDNKSQANILKNVSKPTSKTSKSLSEKSNKSNNLTVNKYSNKINQTPNSSESDLGVATFKNDKNTAIVDNPSMKKNHTTDSNNSYSDTPRKHSFEDSSASLDYTKDSLSDTTSEEREGEGEENKNELTVLKNSIPDQKEDIEKINPENQLFSGGVSFGPVAIITKPFLQNTNSFISDQLESYDEKTRFSFGYGALLKISNNDKYAIRIGFNKIQWLSKMSDIPSDKITGIPFFSFSRPADSELIDITQKIDVYEVPLDFTYRFLEKKINTSVIAGFQYQFIGQNTIILNNSSETIGSASNPNIRDTNVSLHIGLNFEYKLAKKIHLNLDTLFKHQIMDLGDDLTHPVFYLNTQFGLLYTF